MRFIKMHGLGNDFVLLDARNDSVREALPEELADLAVKVCDRNFGVGADGLLIIRNVTDADFGMQIINADGSEPEMCGNGIRCAARYVFEKGGIRQDKLRVKTLAGIIVPEIISENGHVAAVRVDMGEPVLESRFIPVAGDCSRRVVGELLKLGEKTFTITAVSMGNPHCIIYDSDVDKVPLAEWGPAIENHPAFPAKTNVEFVQVINRKEVKMRIWERGAGATLACGTGACAVAVAGVLNGQTERNVKVVLSAGPLFIDWREEDNHVYMTGPAEFVFTGEYPI